MNRSPRAFDLSSTFVHLGLGSVAIELPGFEWTSDYLERYRRETDLDGSEGRLVSVGRHSEDWTRWESHPAGDELVHVLSGRILMIQEISEEENRLELRAGQAIVNPRGVWHTADVLEEGEALYVTPGVGTQHRLRG